MKVHCNMKEHAKFYDELTQELRKTKAPDVYYSNGLMEYYLGDIINACYGKRAFLLFIKRFEIEFDKDDFNFPQDYLNYKKNEDSLLSLEYYPLLCAKVFKHVTNCLNYHKEIEGEYRINWAHLGAIGIYYYNTEKRIDWMVN